MEEEKFETRVVFKMLEEEPIAFLIDVEANPGNVMSYMTIGQHGEASINCTKDCRLAKEEEYKALREELESIGYRLYLRNKFPPRFTRGEIFHKK